MARKKTSSRRKTGRRTYRRTGAVARKRRSYRRNPARVNLMRDAIMPAATGAAGAIGLDVLWGFLPIPENLKMGPVRHLAKAAGAVGLGMIAEKMLGRRQGQQITIGALTVAIHGAMKEGLMQVAPQLVLDEYLSADVAEYLGYYGAGESAGQLPMGNEGILNVGMALEDDYETVTL